MEQCYSKWPAGCQKNGIINNELCYISSSERSSYLSAVSECTRLGGTLAMMKNSLIQALLAETFRKTQSSSQFWAGINDHQLEGTFRYYDGTVLGQFRPWKQNEPDNGIPPNGRYFDYEPEDCVMVNSQEVWVDEKCRYEYYYACEFKRDHVPCNTQLINIPNAEYQHCHTDQMLPHGSFIPIHCQEGFVLVGQNNVTCLLDGEWSSAPQCVQGCISPNALPHATIFNKKDTYVLGEKLIYGCNEGYVTGINQQTTHSKITCNINGKWIPQNAGCSLQEKYTIGLMEVERENSIRLPCVTTIESKSSENNDEDISYFWLKNSEDITKTLMDYSIDQTGTLMINNMSEEAVGQYICFIANEQLTPAMMGFDVKLKPDSCPPCSNQTEAVTFWEGSTSVFKCPHTSSDTHFTWFKNQQRYYVHDEQTLFPDGSLYTTALQYFDSGRYTCQMMKKDSFCKCNHTIDVTVRVSAASACGIVNPEYPHPWAVSLWHRGEIAPFCYGSLINELWVVTSAQCLAGFHRKKRLNVYVRFSHSNTNNSINRNYSRLNYNDIPVKAAKIHPRFSKNMHINDIGILQLLRPVYFTNSIRPICLTEKDLTKVQPCDRLTVINGTVVGWGLLDKNNYEELIMINDSMSVELVSGVCFSTNYSYLSKLICSKKMEGTESTLAGDAGSPFEVLWKDRYYLLGVYSWGERAALMGEHDYFTKISDYFDWLKSFVEVPDKEHTQYSSSNIHIKAVQ